MALRAAGALWKRVFSPLVKSVYITLTSMRSLLAPYFGPLAAFVYCHKSHSTDGLTP